MSDFAVQNNVKTELTGKHFEDLISEMRRQIDRMNETIEKYEKREKELPTRKHRLE